MKIRILILTLLLNSSAIAQEKLVNAVNEFNFSFYNSTLNDTTNLFISPLSLHIALGLVREGTGNSTEQELNKFLQIETIENPSTSYHKLIEKSLNTEDSAYSDCRRWALGQKVGKNDIFLANSIWINDSIEVKEDYNRIAQNNFQSDIESFNIQNLANDNERLNDWLRRKTKGNITKTSPLDHTVMVRIINAIYFQGEWQSSFKKKDTKRRNFHTIQKEKTKIDYLRATRHYKYFENADYKAVQLPYACEQFSLTAILPHKKYDLRKVEKNFKLTDFQTIQDSSYSHEVILSLPKFEIQTELHPKETIIDLGYPEMFSDTADFSKMSSTALKIGSITHKTQIKLDEKKTEASAVSQVDMVIVGYGGGGNPPPPPPPKVFTANHPFMFLITDNRTGVIIFIGRFVTE